MGEHAHLNRRWSAEFALALDCCRWNFRSERAEPIGIAKSIDWGRFLQLARFHGIEGLAWNSLKTATLPDEIGAALKKAASAIAANHLRASSESQRIFAKFQAEGVPILFLKGVTLARLAYRDPTAKAAIDVDVLVDPTDLAETAGLLRQCGYRLVAPRESPDDRVLRAWHRSWKESVWADGLQLDLHTHTADNRRLIPSITVHSPRQTVDVGGGVRLPTLADDELFAYLSVHGASSAWFRLKWIADFAGFLQGRQAATIDRMHRRSQELGAGRASGQALLIADALFGTLNGNTALREALEADRAARDLARSALRQLTGEPVEPTSRRGGTLNIHRTQFALLPGLSYKLTELSRHAVRLSWRLR